MRLSYSGLRCTKSSQRAHLLRERTLEAPVGATLEPPFTASCTGLFYLIL